MLIHPLGIVVSKLFKRTGKHQKDNPLALLAFESTAILFLGLFLAYSVFQIAQLWFFPVMLMLIGGRYLIFQTLYGMKIYWIMGILMIISGAICLISNQPFHIPGIVGGVIELIFGILIIQRDNRT